MNIANFIGWFIQQVINIFSFMVTKLDAIKLSGNISLLDFTMTIAIITVLVGILITSPKREVARSMVGKEKRRSDKKS